MIHQKNDCVVFVCDMFNHATSWNLPNSMLQSILGMAVQGDDSRPAKKATTEAAPKESMRHLAHSAARKQNIHE